MKRILAVVWGVVALAGATAFGATAMPKIVAHRGESAIRPENTLAAFRQSVAAGVWGMECDVYATTDGVPVIIHDATTARTAGGGANFTVTASAWDDLKDVRVTAFGSWATSAYADETLPRFADYLALLEGSSITAVVELKASANGLVDRVVEAVRAQPAATADRVVFISFDAAMIRAVRAALPDYPAWLLLSAAADADAIVAQLASCGATGVDIQSSAAAVNADAIAAVKAAGYSFHVWTVDGVAAAASFAVMGVDSITTDCGTQFLAELPGAIAELDAHAPIVDPARDPGLYTYDVDDYVQDGLVALYDGIRNVGRTQPHDSSATKWADLAAPSRTASIKVCGIDAKTSYKPRNDGEWTRNGYLFSGGCYAQMDAPVALGSQFTIQLATTVDPSVQPAYHYMNVFAAPNDFCMFLSNWNTENRSRWMNWKYEPFKANGSGSPVRPGLNWNGRYLTAMVGADNFLRLFQDGVLPGASVSPAVALDAGATQWTWGGSASGPQDRTTVGTWHCVRLYNRALTAEEVQKNYLVDEFRFRDAGVNVVVASTVPGAEATEPCGSYGVNGTHVFTTPATRTVGSLDYAPVGFQLETWNTLSNVWNKATESTATSYAYTNCAANPRVRLTWIWKPVRGLVKYDAAAYAQHGLLLNFDGIENAGLGRPRTTEKGTWVNCAPYPAQATYGRLARGGDGAWNKKCFDSNGGDFWHVTPTIDFGDKATVQVVCDHEAVRQTDASGSGGWPTLFGNVGDMFNTYLGGWNSGELVLKCDGVVGGDWLSGRAKFQNWPGRTVNVFLDHDSTALRTDTSVPGWVKGAGYKGRLGYQDYYFAGLPNGSTDAARVQRSITASIYAVRAYDRVLSGYELRRNRDIDNARFFGTAPVSVTENGVMVRANVEGLAGAENGFYEVLGDAHTFTCPTEDRVLDGRTYAFAGHTLESFDPAARQWNLLSESADASFTLVPAAGQTHRRLTWKWTLKKGLRTAADYSPADYVQQGLVAHYDGIRNRGADQPHDLKTTRWRDLTDRDNTAALVVTNNTPGAWSADGFSFAGQSHYLMGANVTMGNAFTVQAVLDVDCAKQKTSFPNYVATVEDFGVFTRGTGNVLEWKADTWTGGDWNNRVKQNGWKGDYLTALMTADRQYLFSGTAYANSKARTSTASMGGYRWAIGSATSTSARDWAVDRFMVGNVKAVRFYNRPLTEAELAHNRKVDEIRYRGAVVTNVVVCTNREGVQGVEPDGVYEVVGEWTFTAAPQTVGDTQLEPKGYVLETLENGAWTRTASGSGAAYTYRAAEAAGPVRLTWRFSSNKGTLIVVR